MESPPSTESHGRILAIEEGIAYSRELTRSKSQERLNQALVDIADRNHQPLSTHNLLKNRLLDDVRNARPFSLIRLGDGEGNALFWHTRRAQFPSLASYAMKRILLLMFGRAIPHRKQWGNIAASIANAAMHSCYVGIPSLHQYRQSIQTLASENNPEKDIRGSAGVSAVWDWVAQVGNAWLKTPNRNITIGHVHITLVRFAAELAQASRNISLITCHPHLLARLHCAFGIKIGELFLIPQQAGNDRNTVEPSDMTDCVHYPDVFQELHNIILSKNRTGQLFFVGAGLLGKIYCDAIRQSGGMAIDMGSMLDVLMGQGVRPYQNADFIFRHSLPSQSPPHLGAV